MNVLHIISGGDTGGAKRHILTLLAGLNRRRDVNAMLLCVMEGVFADDARKLGINVVVIPQYRRYNFFVYKKILRLINKNSKCGFDIVHCHGARANFIAMFLRPFIRCKMITTLHSDYRYDFSHSRYKSFVYTPLSILALRLFKYRIAVSQEFKDMLTKRGFDKNTTYIVSNGIDFESKPEFKPPHLFLPSYGIPAGGSSDSKNCYIGIAARLHPVKAVHIFIESAAQVLEQFDNVYFLIAGDGVEYGKCRNLIDAQPMLKKHVFMLGMIDDMESFYNAIDINVLTSMTEGMPYSIVEGARRKKATVCSAVGGLPELISDNETGLLFEAGNASQCAGKLIRLITDPELRLRLGTALYNVAKQKYSAEKMAADHIAVYNEILEL